MATTGKPAEVALANIRANPKNPRLYFNDEKLDQLRGSLQEKGILVPLIVFEDDQNPGHYILMDGERRWRSAVDLGFETAPAQVIAAPDPVENLVQMFNIHAVREEWSLVAIALSLKELMEVTGEERESRLAEMTGLTRSTVRRAKRILTLPEQEIELIQSEAHLDRNEQIHRVDLYLEIERAESLLRNRLPEIADAYERPEIIRQFARKREEGHLNAVTDFRDVGKLVEAAQSDLVDHDVVVEAARDLIEDVELSPTEVFEAVGARAVQQKELTRKGQLFAAGLESLEARAELSGALVDQLSEIRARIDELLGDR